MCFYHNSNGYLAGREKFNNLIYLQVFMRSALNQQKIKNNHNIKYDSTAVNEDKTIMKKCACNYELRGVMSLFTYASVSLPFDSFLVKTSSSKPHLINNFLSVYSFT